MYGTAFLLCCASITANAEPRFFLAANGYKSDDVESWDVGGYEDTFGDYNIVTQAYTPHPGLTWLPSTYDDIALSLLRPGAYIVSQYRTAYLHTGTNSWRQLPPLKSVGKRHTSAVIDGNVYICGGCGCDPEKSCEYIDETATDWKNTSRMINNRMDHCVAVADGKMYAFAGRSLATRQKLSIVEVYDPITNQWSEVVSNFLTFTTCSAAAFQDQIYVCGYNSGQESQCATFEPRTRTWTRLAAPFNQQLGAQETDLGLLAVSENRLFWFDGSSNIYELLDATWQPTDNFDPQTTVRIPVDSVPRAIVGV